MLKINNPILKINFTKKNDPVFQQRHLLIVNSGLPTESKLSSMGKSKPKKHSSGYFSSEISFENSADICKSDLVLNLSIIFEIVAEDIKTGEISSIGAIAVSLSELKEEKVKMNSKSRILALCSKD